MHMTQVWYSRDISCGWDHFTVNQSISHVLHSLHGLLQSIPAVSVDIQTPHAAFTQYK